MSSNYLKLNHDPFEFENRFYCFVGDTSSDPTGSGDDENFEVAERRAEAAQQRNDQQIRAEEFSASTTPRPAPQTPIGMSDDDTRDPYAGTDRTAQNILSNPANSSQYFSSEGYDTTDQSFGSGRARPFGGLTRQQQLNLEGRDDRVARNILAAQTMQPSGVPTTALQGIYTDNQVPGGNVGGYLSEGATLPTPGGILADLFLGPSQVYTGNALSNPYGPPEDVGGDNENAFPFANQQGQQVAQMDPGAVAPEAIDDLAINYLQNPYYAYSGFGNQFSPYGYAPGTLVDLLQTRGMTQPEQADTLGLFGNPTDFS